MKAQAAEIIREYGPFPGIDCVHGVSYDGSQVWFATGSRLQALDPDSGRIVQHPRAGRCRHGLRWQASVPDRQ
jgi:hypothetical protein